MAPKVLIIEDEAAIADTIVYALKTDGFEPVWHTTGQDGRRRLAAGDIALVVLDIGLPDVSGVEVCRLIRQKHDVPIMFLTARSAEVDRVVGLELGADDYVAKPFSPRELAARVKAVLRRSARAERSGRPPPRSVSTGADGRLRTSAKSWISPVTSIDFSVLVQQPGRVYSREQLMDLVWESPEMSLDRTVDAHIKNIRAKLRVVRPDWIPSPRTAAWATR